MERSLFINYWRIFHYFIIYFILGPPFDPQMGSRGVKWGSKVLFAPIFTKFGGKPFYMLLKDLLLLFEQFTLGPHLTPKRGWGGTNGGQMGVKWGSKVIFAPIFTKFGGKTPFCHSLKDLSLFFTYFSFGPPFDPQKGSRGVRWGSKVIFAPIFTKFGGKTPFC